MGFKDLERKRKYLKEYHLKNKERKAPQVRKNWLKREYGLTIEHYNEMLIEQDFSCAICKRHMSNFKRPLHVDHDHENNKVRGLLCNRCNTALGSLGDTKESIENVLKYLNAGI